MSVLDLALALLTSRYVPPPLLRAIARLAVAVLRRRREREDRREAMARPSHPAPAGPLYLVDGYHGGVVFWDWLALPGGGLWYLYNWPLCLEPAVRRALADDRFRVVLDLDGYTYEEMARQAPEAVERMREACRMGRLEVVNGTYGQPLAQSTSGESFLRQLLYGLEAIRRTLGTDVTVFYSQEPAYFPQLPQVLRGFGFEGAIFRTQWAAFGTDPAWDASVVNWRGPDGSTIPTVPRYTFQRYDRLRADHPGLPNMSLAAGDRADWEPDSLAPFERAARERGIAHPLVTDLKDVNLPDAPLPHALEIAAMENVRFVTPTEYLRLADAGGPTVACGPDDIPSTLPWGLQGEVLMRARVAAEGALLTAERLDAATFLLGRESDEERLAEAWKSLCLAQHHDLHVCGPWHSRRHGRSMADVGVEYAVQARRTAEEVAGEALAWLAGRVGGDLLVFNPSPWPRREYVEISAPEALPANGLVLTDGEETIPCQVVSAGAGDRAVGFVLDLPPLGYRCLRWSTRRTELKEEPARAPWYEVRVHPDGSLTVEADGRTLVTLGNYMTVWRDGAWHDSRRGVRRVDRVEEGPVCRRYRVEGEIAGVEFVQTLTLYRRLARIGGRVELDFGMEGVYLGPQMEDERADRAMSVQDERKLCLAFRSPLGRTWCGSPFLLAEARTDRIVGLRWVGLEDGEGRGIAFLNRGTPGYHVERRDGATLLRNVLAWGPREWIYASDNSITRGRSRYTPLRGRHGYVYALLPYASRLAAERAAWDFRLPCLVQPLPGSAGGRVESRSFLTVEPDSVLATALFVHGRGLYLRLWNPSPREAVAVVRVEGGGPPAPVDLDLRRTRRPLPEGRVGLRPWGIQTLSV